MQATKVNAEAIRNLTNDAWEHMRSAQSALSDALRFAQNDYEHNGDKLQDVVGALRLLTATVQGEHHVWDGYAAARARS